MIHSSETDLDFVLEFISPQSSWHAIDLATGTGHLAFKLATVVNSVIASDITPEMLAETYRIIRERGLENVSTATIDVHDIPYNDNEFDLTASRIAPHHFHDIDKAISEMVRVTKSGGYLFIQDTVAPEDHNAAELFNTIEKLRDPSHVRDLSPEEWMQKLEAENCTIIRHYTKSKDWPLRWWTERMSTSLENVKEIIAILEDIYEDYKDIINIAREVPYQSGSVGDVIDKWSLHPNNGYFLAMKG